MKIFALIFLLLLFVFAHAQDTRYTHRTMVIGYNDAVLMVPNVKNVHHLLAINTTKKSRLTIYDKDLQWQQEIKLPIPFTENTIVSVLPTDNGYYLYNSTATNKRNYSLWKIDAAGNPTNQTEKLHAVIKASFPDSSITFEMVNTQSCIYLLGYSYYPDMEKMMVTIVSADNNLDDCTIKRTMFDFNLSYEKLYDILLVGNRHLLLLKSNNSEGSHVVDLLKINLQTEETTTISFNSGAMPLTAPHIAYNAKDSSIVIQAQLYGDIYSDRPHPVFFLTKLDNNLKQLIAPTIIKSKVGEDICWGYIQAGSGNGINTWSTVNFMFRFNLFLQNPSLVDGSVSNIFYIYPKNNTYARSRFQSQPCDMKLIVTDDLFKVTFDSTVKNNNRTFLKKGLARNFIMDNNNYLLLQQQFPSHTTGFVLINANKEGKIVANNLRLYDRYDYLPEQFYLQPNTHTALIPYINKREAGIISATLPHY